MRFLRPHILTLATGLLAAAPVIAATVHALAIDWMPLGDRAVIAIRSLDVLSDHPPLLGQFSATSQVLGDVVHSPGPMLYWVLALPVRISYAAPAVAIGLMNTAAVVGTVVLARRRGGLPLMFATAAGVALVVASLEPSLPYDIWNPAAGVMPFTLTVFLAWSLACGEWKLLPLTAVTASFCVQAHLGFALPVAAALAVAAAFLIARRPRLPRTWLLATAAAVLVCWIGPLAESVIHRPGNLEQIVRVAHKEKDTLGIDSGVYATARAFGLPAWWMRSPRDTGTRVAEVEYAPPAHVWVGGALVLLALAALVVAALRRGRRETGAGLRDAAAAGAISLSLAPALLMTTASSPTQGLLYGTIGYTVWWAHPAGMFAVLALGTMVARLVAFRRAPPRVAVRVVAAATAAVALVVVLNRGEDRLEGAYEPGRDVAQAASERTPPGPVAVRATPTILGYEFEGAAALALRRRGPRPRTQLPVGTPYKLRLKPYAATLWIADGPAPRTGRTIARFVLNGVPGDAPPRESANRRITVTLDGG